MESETERLMGFSNLESLSISTDLLRYLCGDSNEPASGLAHAIPLSLKRLSVYLVPGSDLNGFQNDLAIALRDKISMPLKSITFMLPGGPYRAAAQVFIPIVTRFSQICGSLSIGLKLAGYDFPDHRAEDLSGPRGILRLSTISFEVKAFSR